MSQKRWIIFTDSGDTIVDEGSEYRSPGSDIVEHAQLIPGAREALLWLKEQGYQIQMVADGYVESFDNVYRQHGLEEVFCERTISEVVGVCKPSAAMFETAMKKMGLTDADKSRIVMIGNNLERDVVGANRFGITSVLMSWSPRYNMVPKNEEERPDYVIESPSELPALMEKLERME